MEIIGRGYLAGGLMPIADAHPGVVAAAFGVSVATGASESDFARDAERLYDVMRRCAEQGKKLLFFSTASPAMYALPGEPGRESGPVCPSTAYGRHKLAMEAVLAASSIDYLALRVSHVVGPTQPAHQLLPSLVRQIRSGTVTLYRGARRDLIDATDVVHVVDRLLKLGVSRAVVNVATGRSVPIEEIVDHVEARLGIEATRQYVTTVTSQSVSTAELHRLVPEIALTTVDYFYYRRVLDKYLPEYAATPLRIPV